MRARMLILVLAILVVAGFAAQNWGEINHTSLLNFGVVQAEAPLGLILLTLLGLTLLVFLATAATMRTQSLVESRHHARALNAQRDLAEKAEASRFTDLRGLLDGHLREMRQRESIGHTEMERTMAQHQRELRNQLEQMYHLLTSRISEMERRLDGRGPVAAVEREPMATRIEPSTVDSRPVHVPPGRERV
ncbi:hypothetical protein [Ramlibacter humi]|uniref:LapA family protein n=1 Tax=Ramlibacter humi TaxID=2530451 RepID=A0A4Z0CB30_9BURK|nr:hypothetical protein [Ramlibacter humi]TFZ08224.1 hypothetical protein EZ216_03420 [Ramlibacter humi]